MEPLVWTVEGSAVYGEYHAPAKRKGAAVLLVHGFNSDRREFGPLAERLAASGHHVLAFDQRGFGKSGGEPGRIGLDRALQDVEAAVAQLRERAGRKTRLVAVGHSLGAAYLLGIQARHSWFDALVIAHAVDSMLDEAGGVERVMLHAVGRLHRRRMNKGRPARTMPYRVGYRDLFVDKDAREAAKREGFLAKTVNMANYDFASTMQASRWAHKVTCPVLCVQSPADRVVSPAHSQVVYDALRGDTSRVDHRGGHSCFLDLDRDLIADRVTAWVSL